MKSILKYCFIFLLAFSIAGTIGFYSIRLFTQSADEIVLPQLTGKNIIYVLETLTNMGLNAKLYGSRYDDAVPRYAVISQDPQPGSTIKKGRDIIIYISKGAKENIIPDLRQIPLKQALILLEKNEFKKGHVSFTYSLKTKNECVIAHYPEPFSTALKGSSCDLLISRGINPVAVIMPDITRLRLEKASAVIENLHLDISQIISNVDPHQDWGIILSSTPHAGSHVTANTPITLVVNALEKGRHMSPDKLNSLILLTHSLSPGILKQHVRVETDMFGPIINLYNEYMKPGEDINILVPPAIKTRVNIFIDQTLEKTIIIDPWKEDIDAGDSILWESSPLQFYQPISPDWVTN
ncbi:PASTA domain-containing protein [Desulfobacula toluolica]|uniref:PASTA-domain protein n=1 Tax=Desulfobacula toluolica (strain DSM 7467 / Tol2) TaxID=651182 RepID=K0NEW2_DESTT|nr:PASTA domain-containing protein [Desulfobacula toluolica]CCK79651.1 PASTA-domain protein [Desulfobacula toluolica Tol2]